MEETINIIQEILRDREKGSARLVAEYRDRLYAVAFDLCRNAAEADDLVFRTFEQVLDKIESCSSEASFYAWMCSILRNFHRLSVRRPVNRNTVPVGGGPDIEKLTATISADNIVDALDAAILRESIERMPPKMREVLILHYFLEQPVSQIARYLMLPMGTVLSRLHYARSALAMRIGAKLKKPAVALIAAAFALLASATVAIGTLATGDSAAEEKGRSGVAAPAAGGVAPSDGAEAGNGAGNTRISSQKDRRTSMTGMLRGLCTKMQTAFVTALATTLLAELHADDPYIESDGTTIVNSRYFANPQTVVEVDYEFADATASSEWNYVFGAADNNPNSAIGTRAGLFVNNNGPYFVAGDVNGKWVSDYSGRDTKRHVAKLDVAALKCWFGLKGGVATEKTLPAEGKVSLAGNYPIALFGNMAGQSGLAGVGGNYSKVRIYRARFWTGGHLDHDYTPCVKGGVPGFADAVDGAFVTAENPAALTAGAGTPEVADDGYISTYGNNAAKGSNLYIDTGYIVKDDTRLELDFALADNYPGSGDWDVFSSCKNMFNFYFNANGGNWNGPDKQWQAFSPTIPKRTTDMGVRRKIVMDNALYQATFTTAGFTNAVGTSTASSGTDYATPASGAVANLRLASRVDASASKPSCAAPIKIYGLKLYEGETLVHDYAPRVRNGVAGLFDIAGDGGFISCADVRKPLACGGAIEADAASRDAYVEGDGTQAFNTGYHMNGRARIEVDFSYVEPVASQSAIFGAWTCKNGSTAGYINGSGGFSMALSDGWSASVMASSADTARHTAIIDAPGRSLRYVTGAVTNTLSAGAYAGAAEAEYPMGLLAGIGNAAGTSWIQNAKARIYAFRIYEDGGDTPAHEYLPYVKGATVGLRDAVTGALLTDARGSSAALTAGGMGADGAERWFKKPSPISLKKTDVPAMLSAAAVGAVSYRWTRNGDALAEGADGELEVAWRKAAAPDVYTVTPVYRVFGEDIAGEPLSVTVTNELMGTIISFK